MSLERKILFFKRLNLADLCFKQTEALAEYVRDTKPDPARLLYSPMIAGVVVTYMRPFVQSDGLGSLSREFTTFLDQDLCDMHRQLEESRNKLYAHRDLCVAPALQTDGGIPFQMRIEFQDVNRAYSLLPGSIDISPASMDHIIRLCLHQQSKITEQLRNLMPSLIGGKHYPPGTYTVGVDFP